MKYNKKSLRGSRSNLEFSKFIFYKWISILFILLTSYSIYPESQVVPEVIGVSQSTKEKSITNQIENSKQSDSLFIVNFNLNSNKDLFLYNIDFKILKRANNPEYKDYFYLGNNAYISFPLKKFNLNLGRKIQVKQVNLFEGWSDGTEGITFETEFFNSFKIGIVALDFYRGFSLINKNYLLDYSNIETPKSESFRQGFFVEYSKNTHNVSLSTNYINLSNSGLFSSDDASKLNNGKDKDYIYNLNVSYIEKLKYVELGIGLKLNRGIDKATSNPAIKQKSIPFSGELIVGNIQSSYRNFSFRQFYFIPDSDKRNKQNEILELGYIGTGTIPMNSFLLTQHLNYYPSNWITNHGFEKNNSYKNSRSNSFWMNTNFSLRIKEKYSIQINHDHIIPRSITSDSNGSISINKKDYSRNFLSELTLAFEYGSALENYFFKLSFSKLFSSKDIAMSGESFFIQGGFKF